MIFDRKGFKVYVKQHPREADINYLNARMLPRTVPIEIFSLLGINFHYAVSLHSAGIQDEFVIAKIQKNLVPLKYFDADHFHLWEDIVVKGLDEMME
ncbi:hypothetical protein [Vibrio taketomensis]|uniref:hypothetical protein n=1 Tax=Vibrio taketomensis TaxID=2572923 RepID=UPI00138A4F31|nr:hypothetical protein [Vibrio taketomensis]